MRLLAIDAAHGRPAVAVLEDTRLVVLQRGAAGPAFAIAALAETALAKAHWTSFDLDAVAASVGPGSFTGIRAGLALARGIALVRGIPIIGVTTGEVAAAAIGDTGGRALWVATETHRAGRIYLECDGEAHSVALERVAAPAGPVLLAGDAAATLAALLRARGADVTVAATGEADATALGRAAFARATGRLAPRPPVPLYVDPPAARRAFGPIAARP